MDGSERVLGRLRELVAGGEAIAFVGAGASVPLYPLWRPLIRLLADQAVAQGLADAQRHAWGVARAVDDAEHARDLAQSCGYAWAERDAAQLLVDAYTALGDHPRASRHRREAQTGRPAFSKPPDEHPPVAETAHDVRGRAQSGAVGHGQTGRRRPEPQDPPIDARAAVPLRKATASTQHEGMGLGTPASSRAIRAAATKPLEFAASDRPCATSHRPTCFSKPLGLLEP